MRAPIEHEKMVLAFDAMRAGLSSPHHTHARNIAREHKELGYYDAETGSNLLHYAAENGDLVTIEYILNIEWPDIDAKNLQGHTAISLAAAANHLAIVHTLLLHNATWDNKLAINFLHERLDSYQHTQTSRNEMENKNLLTTLNNIAEACYTRQIMPDVSFINNFAEALKNANVTEKAFTWFTRGQAFNYSPIFLNLAIYYYRGEQPADFDIVTAINYIEKSFIYLSNTSNDQQKKNIIINLKNIERLLADNAELNQVSLLPALEEVLEKKSPNPLLVIAELAKAIAQGAKTAKLWLNILFNETQRQSTKIAINGILQHDLSHYEDMTSSEISYMESIDKLYGLKCSCNIVNALASFEKALTENHSAELSADIYREMAFARTQLFPSDAGQLDLIINHYNSSFAKIKKCCLQMQIELIEQLEKNIAIFMQQNNIENPTSLCMLQASLQQYKASLLSNAEQIAQAYQTEAEIYQRALPSIPEEKSETSAQLAENMYQCALNLLKLDGQSEQANTLLHAAAQREHPQALLKLADEYSKQPEHFVDAIEQYVKVINTQDDKMPTDASITAANALLNLRAAASAKVQENIDHSIEELVETNSHDIDINKLAIKHYSNNIDVPENKNKIIKNCEKMLQNLPDGRERNETIEQVKLLASSGTCAAANDLLKTEEARIKQKEEKIDDKKIILAIQTALDNTSLDDLIELHKSYPTQVLQAIGDTRVSYIEQIKKEKNKAQFILDALCSFMIEPQLSDPAYYLITRFKNILISEQSKASDINYKTLIQGMIFYFEQKIGICIFTKCRTINKAKNIFANLFIKITQQSELNQELKNTANILFKFIKDNKENENKKSAIKAIKEILTEYYFQHFSRITESFALNPTDENNQLLLLMSELEEIPDYTIYHTAAKKIINPLLGAKNYLHNVAQEKKSLLLLEKINTAISVCFKKIKQQKTIQDIHLLEFYAASGEEKDLDSLIEIANNNSAEQALKNRAIAAIQEISYYSHNKAAHAKCLEFFIKNLPCHKDQAVKFAEYIILQQANANSDLAQEAKNFLTQQTDNYLSLSDILLAQQKKLTAIFSDIKKCKNAKIKNEFLKQLENIESKNFILANEYKYNLIASQKIADFQYQLACEHLSLGNTQQATRILLKLALALHANSIEKYIEIKQAQKTKHLLCCLLNSIKNSKTTQSLATPATIADTKDHHQAKFSSFLTYLLEKSTYGQTRICNVILQCNIRNAMVATILLSQRFKKEKKISAKFYSNFYREFKKMLLQILIEDIGCNKKSAGILFEEWEQQAASNHYD